MNFALDEHQEVRADGQPRQREGFHQPRHVAPGVDDPLDPLRLQRADQPGELRRDGRVLELGIDGAVEVG